MPELIRRSTFSELADYSDHLDRLAARAETAAAAPAATVTLAERASLASEAARLLWLAMTPAAIAASCKATSLLGEPVLIGFLPLDQQLLQAHALRDAGVLDQQVQGQRREPEPERAEVAHVEEEPVDAGEPVVGEEVEVVEEVVDQGAEEQEEMPAVDVGEPVAEEREELLEVDHQGDEEQQIEEQQIEEEPAAAEWVGSPELSELLHVSAGTVRSWSGKGWFVLGDHFIQDPSDRRRYLYNVERCRETASERSRKLRGVACRTPEGIEERRQLRVKRQNLRRQAKRNAEEVGQEPEQAGGGRLEELLTALLMEVRGSGS